MIWIQSLIGGIIGNNLELHRYVECLLLTLKLNLYQEALYMCPMMRLVTASCMMPIKVCKCIWCLCVFTRVCLRVCVCDCLFTCFFRIINIFSNVISNISKFCSLRGFSLAFLPYLPPSYTSPIFPSLPPHAPLLTKHSHVGHISTICTMHLAS